MASQTPIGSTKNMISLNYGTVSVGDANGTMRVGNFANIFERRMPSPGAVVGITSQLSGTLTTGTLTFYLTKNGSPTTGGTFGQGTVNISTFGTYERDPAYLPQFTFAAGDTIGVGFSKAGTIAPTTRDMEVTLLVLLDQYDY